MKTSKIERMKAFNEWLYTRVHNIYPMTVENFENIIEKI